MTAFGGGNDYNANVVLTANVSQYASGMGQAQQATDATSGAVEKLLGTYGKLKEATRTKFISWDKEAAFTLAGSVAAAGLFEKQLSTLSATAAVTGKNMNGFRDAINGAFAKLPVARGDLVALATQINQMGVTAPQQIGKLVEVFTKLASVTGGDAGELAASMMQFTQSMGDTSVGNVKAMSDQLVSLSKNAGISASSMLNFAQAIAPIARVSGMTESQVLGLSAAFSKAGSDGYVAANTFNSMVADITQLSAAGSPQLAKYANSLGMTTDQFKKMPAANAVAQLFDKVNKAGADGINILNQWGINGVRSITAVQQVAQSGQLDQLLAASNAQGSNGALDKGAQASMGGLADALAETRNQFTMYGTYLGQHVIGPMTSLVHIVNSAVSALGLLKPVLAPVLGIVGVGGQLLGGIAGIASPLMMGAWAMRSPIGRNLAMGYRMGRARRTSPEAEMALEERYAAMGRTTDPAQMGALSRAMYTAGVTGGAYTQRAIYGETGEAQRGLILRNMAMRLPFQGVRSLMQSQAQYQRNAVNPAGFEAPMAERAAGAIGGAIGFIPATARSGLARIGALFSDRATAETISAQSAVERAAYRIHAGVMTAPSATVGRAATLAQTTDNPEVRTRALNVVSSGLSPAQLQASMTMEEKALAAAAAAQNKATGTLAALTKSLQDNIAKAEALNTEEGRATETFKVLQQEISATIKSMGELAVTTASASARVLGQAAGAVLPRAGSALGGGLMSLGKQMLTNPWFVIPEATMGITKFKDYLDNRAADTTDTTGKYLNPIQQYNTALGIATTKLADLSNAASNAAAGLAANGRRITSSTPMAQVLTVSHADALAAARQGKSKDDNISNIAGLHPEKASSVSALASYAQTLDMSDPRQVQQFKVNALAAGFSQSQVRGILSGNINPAHTSYGPLVSAAMGMEGRGSFAMNTSKAGGRLLDAAQTKVLNDFAQNQTQYGTAFASQLQLQDVSNIAAIAGTGIGGKTWTTLTTGSMSRFQGQQTHSTESGQGDIQKKAIAQALAEQFGGDYTDYYNVLKGTDLSKMSLRQRQQFILDKVIPATKTGANTLKQIRAAGGTTAVSQFAQVDRELRMGGMSQQSQAALAQQGPLGVFALHSQAVQQAAQHPQDPARFEQAMQALSDQALKVGKNFSGAIDQLEKIKAGIQDSTDATYQAADAAQQWIQSLQQAKMQGMSRGAQGQELLANFQNAIANRYSGAPDAGKQFTATQQAFTQWGSQQNQWMISVEQTAKQFGLQMQRSDDQFHLQIDRSWASFGRQMKWSQQDFQTQRARSYRDFNKQMARMAEDEAKSAYNPFQRVQAQFTIDAGTMLQNLQDQNQRIEQQQSNLALARRLGLSKQTIRQLDLANPANAQELQNIVDTLKNNPKVAREINQQVRERIRAMAKLAKSEYSTTYTRAYQDFKQGLRDAQHDYDRARRHALISQHIAIGQMFTDYKTQVRNAGQDLNIAMTEITTTGEKTQIGALNAVSKYVDRWAPHAANTMRTALHVLDPYIQFVNDNPGLMKGDPPKPSTPRPGLGDHPGTYQVMIGGKLVTITQPEPGPSAPHATPHPHHHRHHQAPVPGVTEPGLIGAPHHHRHHRHHPAPPTGGGHHMAFAEGGISRSYGWATISEGNKPEAVIPLDQRGMSFMTSFYKNVARQVVQSMGMTGYASPVAGHRGTTTINQDFSTRFTGDIKITASDYKKLMAELDAKKRLAKLASPGHRG